MSDVGQMTTGVIDNLKDIAEVWLDPARRSEFGPREHGDLNQAYLALTLLLTAIDPDLTPQWTDLHTARLGELFVDEEAA